MPSSASLFRGFWGGYGGGIPGRWGGLWGRSPPHWQTQCAHDGFAKDSYMSRLASKSKREGVAGEGGSALYPPNTGLHDGFGKELYMFKLANTEGTRTRGPPDHGIRGPEHQEKKAQTSLTGSLRKCLASAMASLVSTQDPCHEMIGNQGPGLCRSEAMK